MPSNCFLYIFNFGRVIALVLINYLSISTTPNKEAKMKRMLFLLAALSLFAASTASAGFISTYYDLNTLDPTYFNVDDGVTESFYEFTYYALTNSEISNTGVIVDNGVARSTGLNTDSGDIPGDTEGYGSLWGLAFVWDDLTGQVTYNDGSVIEAIYTSGTFNFYVDFDPYAVNLNTPATLTDGTLVATVEITSGSYRLDLTGDAGSSYLLYGNFTYLLDDFMYSASGQDLNDLVGLGWVYAYTAGDNDPETVEITFNDDQSISVFSSHDSSVSVGVVPEPSTMILLGMGFMGLGIVAYRKRKM